MTPDPFSHFIPTRILYGPGMVSDLAAEMEDFGPRRAYVVTEAILVRLGYLDRLRRGLEGSPVKIVGVCDGVVPNSDVALVERAGAEAGSLGADLVIGMGGGSSLDTAKAVNILLTLGGSLLEYQGAQVLGRKLHPMVAIPTTAGTGSEVTNVAAIHDPASDTKLLFVDHHLMPDLAVLDPELTWSAPPRVTAATGMDALTHALEAYVSTMAYPIADAMALHATSLLMEYLPRAARDGGDHEARAQLLIAACEAGMAFVHAGVGLVHALSHTLGGVLGVPHGEGNAIILPHGMAYNLPECPERFAELARVMGEETTGLDPESAGRRAVDRVVALRAELESTAGLPSTLAGTGVARDRFPEIAGRSLLDGAIIYNRRAPSEDDVLAILERAWEHPAPA